MPNLTEGATITWIDLLILPLAISLGVDAFSVALGASVFPTDDERRRTFRLVFHFGLFQGGMTLLGWLGGRTIEPLVASFDHWVAFALLAYVGGRMLHSAVRSDQCGYREDPSRGVMLVLLSVGTSIDALAVGLSLALTGSPVLWPSLAIAVVAAAMTFIGLKLGHRLGLIFGRPVQLLGGLVLLVIGVRVVLSHLAA
jgi:putative Mn2+ efflux pump MntP